MIKATFSENLPYVLVESPYEALGGLLEDIGSFDSFHFEVLKDLEAVRTGKTPEYGMGGNAYSFDANLNGVHVECQYNEDIACDVPFEEFRQAFFDYVVFRRQPLLDFLRQEDPTINWQPDRTMGTNYQPQAVPALIKALSLPPQRLRRCAADVLIAIGSPAVPALIKTLEKGTDAARWASAQTLGFIGDERGIEPLIKAFQTDNKQVAWIAASSLGQLGAVAALPALTESLNKADLTNDLAYYVTTAIGDIAENQLARDESSTALTTLKDLRKHSSAKVRETAHFRLAEIEQIQTKQNL